REHCGLYLLWHASRTVRGGILPAAGDRNASAHCFSRGTNDRRGTLLHFGYGGPLVQRHLLQPRLCGLFCFATYPTGRIANLMRARRSRVLATRVRLAPAGSSRSGTVIIFIWRASVKYGRKQHGAAQIFLRLPKTDGGGPEWIRQMCAVFEVK